MFETVYVKDDAEGYADWLKSDEDMYDINDIHKSRKQILQNTICITDPDVYQSNPGYGDLKDAYRNTLFDVDEDAVLRTREQFHSEGDYIKYRTRVMNGVGISLDESNRILKENHKKDCENMLHLSYTYKEKQEQYESRMNKYKKHFLKLE